MANEAPLHRRVYEDRLYAAICRAVHYTGFPFRELAERMRPLVAAYGARKVAAALSALVTHQGWRTMLNPQARKACWGLLGPPPEKWDEFYLTWDGKPLPRPAHHQVPPVIPEREIEPILDALTRLTATQLDIKLRECRAALRKKVPEHERQLALETIPRVESEMVRRGEDIPPEAPEAPAEEKPKRTRKRKE